MPPDAGAQIFAIESPRTVRNLADRFRKRIAELSAQVAAGTAQDWADYRRRVGEIQGLTEALTILQEVEKEDRR